MTYEPTAGVPEKFGPFRKWVADEFRRVQRGLHEDHWRDIVGQIQTRVGGINPAWSIIDAGPFYAYKFTIGDEIFCPFHIPHDLVPDNDIHFHVHWMPDSVDTNTVKWQFDCAGEPRKGLPDSRRGIPGLEGD